MNPLTLGCVTDASTGLLSVPSKSLVEFELWPVLPTILFCSASWFLATNELLVAGLLEKLKRSVEAVDGLPGWVMLPKRFEVCAGFDV